MALLGGSFSEYLLNLPWEAARGFIKEEFEQLRAALQALFATLLTADGTLAEGAVLGGGANVPSYVANTGPHNAPKWDKVDLASGVKNRLRYLSLPAPTTGLQSLIGHELGANFAEILLENTNLLITASLLDLTDTGVIAGTYGDVTHIPVITVDAKGRVTNATEIFNAGGSGSYVPVSLGTEPLTFLSDGFGHAIFIPYTP